MIEEDKAHLWRAISGFPLDDRAAERPFSLRLRQENAWTEEFTQRVVCEYKRFVFLCMVADHHCVPSGFVDQAWHLHILNLQSYLFEFCHQVLGRILWHKPNPGGVEAKVEHHDLYVLTLESYQRWFGATPPPDIWGRCVAVRHHEGKAVGVAELFTPEITELVSGSGEQSNRVSP